LLLPRRAGRARRRRAVGQADEPRVSDFAVGRAPAGDARAAVPRDRPRLAPAPLPTPRPMTPDSAPNTERERDVLLTLCRECVRGVLADPAREVPIDVPLSALGLDSRALLAFVAELSRRVGRALDPALPFAHPTLAGL